MEPGNGGKLQNDTAQFIAGSEFNDIYLHEVYWGQTLAAVRTVLPKDLPIFVVANWDRFDQIPFVDACSYIGLSAYFPLIESPSANTSTESLVGGWQKWRNRLVSYSRSVNRPLYFAELGYSSIVTAAATPWDYAGNAAQDLGLQARLFEALNRAWAQTPELHRIMIWSLNPSAEPLKDRGFDVFGKPAEQAVNNLLRSNP